MKIVYLAGPYRASTVRQIELNIRRAEEYSLKIWKAGGACICPHMNTRLFDGELPDEVWLDGATSVLLRSDALALMPEWRQSEGSRDEFKQAQLAKIDTFDMGDVEQEAALYRFLKNPAGGNPVFAEADRLRVGVRSILRCICSTCAEGQSTSCLPQAIKSLRELIGVRA